MYCNYSKDKFNNEITFIIPNWVPLNEQRISTDFFGAPLKDYGVLPDFLYGLGAAEKTYFRLLHFGWSPQQARNVLPLATKCDLVMTGFIEDWSGFFKLRCSTAAHPQAKELADSLKQEFIKLGIYEG